MQKISSPSDHQKPLESIKRLFIWLNLYRDEPRSKMEGFAYPAFFILSLLISISYTVFPLAFFIEYFHTDFTRSLRAFWGAAGVIVMIYSMIAALFSRAELSQIFSELTLTYSDNKEADSFNVLIDANRKSEWMWSIYRNYVLCTIASLGLTAIISVIYCWFVRGSFDAYYVDHPCNFILPWNRTTLSVYSMEIGTIILTYISFQLPNGAFLLLFVSSCIHHRAFYKMFKHSIDKLNQDKERRCDEQFLCELVRFHISVKSWFVDSANFYSPFVLVQLICTVVNMAICIFYLDTQRHNVKSDFVSVVFGFVILTANLFIYCYFGELTTQSFVKMSESLNNISWIEVPVKLQKHLILIIANMQNPIHYHGFGVANLNLNTFITLVKNIYSYYMIFKTLISNQM